MTTVEQLIKHLQTLPQQAIVQVTNDLDKYIDLDLDEHVYVLDLRGNRHVKEDSPSFNKVWVQLGE